MEKATQPKLLSPVKYDLMLLQEYGSREEILLYVVIFVNQQRLGLPNRNKMVEETQTKFSSDLSFFLPSFTTLWVNEWINVSA